MKEYIIVSLVFCLLSFLFVALTSDSTSFLYSTDPYLIESTDSANFVVIGKHWILNGKIPYMDLFDQKGPMIFLINGLGYILTGNVHGIMLFQALFISLYCIISYHTLRIKKTRVRAFFWVIISLLFLGTVYGGGNLVEEYDLPFIALSLLGIYKWSISSKKEHSIKWAFVYGICISFFVLNRATDAIITCVGCLVIAIFLIKYKQIKNLLYNILFVVLGFIALMIPFVLYFLIHGAIEDFWYGMIGFNIIYATERTTPWLFTSDIKTLLSIAVHYIPILGTLWLGINCMLKKHFQKGIIWTSIAICGLFFLLFSKLFNHYLVDYIPLTIIIGCEIKAIELRTRKTTTQLITIGVLIICILSAALENIKFEWNILNEPTVVWKEQERKPYDDLIELIPKSDYDSVVFYNCDASLYLRSNICPCYKYFSFQDWQGGKAEEMMDRIIEVYNTKEAKWILIHAEISCGIQFILDMNYSLIDKRDAFSLYRLE